MLNYTPHVLVTGANGFVGRALCEALINNNIRVSAIVRSLVEGKMPLGEIYQIDLTDSVRVKKLFRILQPDFVIHLAGSKNRSLHSEDFNKIYTNNVLISMNVIDACLSLPNFDRLVFIGSCDEYGDINPPYCETQKELATNAYGLSKLAITQVLSGLFISNKLPSVVLRPSVIYGAGQGNEMFLSALIHTLLLKKDFLMTEGEQKRDFVYIKDVINAIIKAINADRSINGKVINIGSGIAYKIKDIAMLTSSIIDGNGDYDQYLKFGAYSYRANEVMNYSVSTVYAVELLNWKAEISLKAGLKETVRYIKNI